MHGPFDDLDLLIRLAVACGLGLLLGIDREVKGFAAGIRTHAMIAVSAAAVMISAALIHRELRADGTYSDPLRVIQGLAQAVGFIGAGLIVFTRGRVRNLTSAANIWLTTVVGIAAGAGQFLLAGFATGFGLFLLVVVGAIERWLWPEQSNEEDARDRP